MIPGILQLIQHWRDQPQRYRSEGCSKCFTGTCSAGVTAYGFDLSATRCTVGFKTLWNRWQLYLPCKKHSLEAFEPKPRFLCCNSGKLGEILSNREILLGSETLATKNALGQNPELVGYLRGSEVY